MRIPRDSSTMRIPQDSSTMRIPRDSVVLPTHAMLPLLYKPVLFTLFHSYTPNPSIFSESPP